MVLKLHGVTWFFIKNQTFDIDINILEIKFCLPDKYFSENSIQIWDLALSFLDPASTKILKEDDKPIDIIFTPNGFNLCISFLSGYITFFTILGLTVQVLNPKRSLMINIAKSLEDRKYLITDLCNAQPEYKKIFKKLNFMKHNKKKKDMF